MTSKAKDTEISAASAAPAASTALKSPVEAAPRPQPVALEVPVTVNGARTVEGSEKREPFSEKSVTVLVFGHGAVIRVSALLAPGQLVFLTNEKTKKEVVCQVVKSKTDGNAVGYVALRFTEPAPGFWGMRFPSDTVLPQAPQRPAASPAPALAPAAGKVAALVTSRPTVGAPPVVAKPVIPSLVPAAPVSPAAAPAAPTAAPVVEPKPAFPTPPPPAPFVAPPAPAASAPVSPVIESKSATSTPSAPASSVSDPSTGQLKQQAARLQEQLSSMLFTEAPKSAAPVAPVSTPAPEMAQKVLEPASSAPESAPAKAAKSSPLPQGRPSSSSLDVEEIKIPSWLVPLARETDASASAPSANPHHLEGTNSDVVSEISPAPEQAVSTEDQESFRRPETAVFGGQLLGETPPSGEAPAAKSKTGLFIGIAASLLLVAGGVWYARQPGNAISAMLNGESAPQASAAPAGANAPAESVSERAGAVPAPAPAPAVVDPPVEPPPALSAPVERASRNVQPTVEQPKKPSLGHVHLATPVINRGAAASSSSDPALEINSSANASAPLSTLGGSHRAGPVAPTPVGGDVKPAKLVKSVPPVYPEMARNQRISGNVQIDALIEADGNVSAMKVLSGPPLLHQAALNALKQWKYEPAQLDGKATSMHLTVTIQFRTQ